MINYIFEEDSNDLKFLQNSMRIKISVLIGAILPTILVASPGYGDSFRTHRQCSYQERGKPIVVNQCLLEGSSGQGLTLGTLTWQDGVKTRIRGNFTTLKQWSIDGSPATVVEWPTDTQDYLKHCLKSDLNGTLICWWKAQQIPQRYNCPLTHTNEQASRRYKKVRIDEEKIEFEIPDNYRIMKRQDGSTIILHPGDFEFLQCMERGGRGGRGYASQTIQLINIDESMDLKDQAILEATDKTATLDKNLTNVESVFKFQTDNMSGYVVVPKLKYSSTFLGVIPGSNKALIIKAGCDCEVDTNSFLRLVSTIKFYE
jgi:hypothetical protein